MTSYRMKLVTRDSALEKVAQMRHGLKIGYTSGVFDILHSGHVDYLEKARALVDFLIVGINSDTSVRLNKGEFRPIFNELERAHVLGGLGSVDLIFTFEEQNNNKNIELLKPDVYIKAGDYQESTLSSKPFVEAYGGRVEIVPFSAGHSTSSAIERIIIKHGLVQSGEKKVYEKRPAIFFDRDGTLIENVEYLSDPKQCKLLPGAALALKRASELGYRLIMVTNQPGIGLGYFTQEDFYRVTQTFFREISKEGILFDKIYFCPHNKSEDCLCRKPKTYFLERAVQELNVDLSKSFMVGDMTSDIKFAKNGNVRSVLVKTGSGGSDGLFLLSPTIRSKVSHILTKCLKKSRLQTIRRPQFFFVQALANVHIVSQRHALR